MGASGAGASLARRTHFLAVPGDVDEWLGLARLCDMDVEPCRASGLRERRGCG
jgi:hypothetical protein